MTLGLEVWATSQKVQPPQLLRTPESRPCSSRAPLSPRVEGSAPPTRACVWSCFCSGLCFSVESKAPRGRRTQGMSSGGSWFPCGHPESCQQSQFGKARRQEGVFDECLCVRQELHLITGDWQQIRFLGTEGNLFVWHIAL